MHRDRKISLGPDSGGPRRGTHEVRGSAGPGSRVGVRNRPASGLRLDGLMTIPPFFPDPDQTRPFFAELHEIRDRLESESPGSLGKKHLSMGMSHDFEIAIAEGATIVRIGT